MFSKQIALRNLTWNDRVYFYEWINDDEVIKYSLSLFQKLNTKQDIDHWFQSVLDDKKSISKAIVFENVLIGSAGISSLNKSNNNGEYFIFIGDKEKWGKGIGTYVTKEIIDFAFDEQKLNRLSLTVSDINTYAVKAYLSAGFIEEGRMRQACFRDGKYHDKVMMSIIKDDR